MLSSPQKNKLFLVLKSPEIITIFVFILGLVAILNHAMWRDELQAWLLVKESNSFSELLGYLEYEGHPLLWFLCLKFLIQFSENPLIMQLFHLILGSGTIYILFKFSPFSLREKLLLTFSHLLFYEYLIISRNYGIGVFLLFLICTLYSQRRKFYLLLSILLFLLAQTNFYALLIAIALGTTLIVEYCYHQFHSPHPVKLKRNQVLMLISSVFIFLAGITLSLIIIIPAEDSALGGNWFFQYDSLHLGQVLNLIWSSYFPILVPSSRPLDTAIFALISFVILLATITRLKPKPFALLFYLLGTGEILLFAYTKALGSPRHYCHLFILLIAVFWLSRVEDNSPLLFNFKNRILKQWHQWVNQVYPQLWLLILYSQLMVGVYLFTSGLITPLSAGKATAEFIQKEQLADAFIVGSRDFTMIPIAGYLNRKIYYPEIQRLGSFVSFTTERKDVTDAEILQQLVELNQRYFPVLLILNHALESSHPQLKINQIQSFTRSRFHDERYYLYQVE